MLKTNNIATADGTKQLSTATVIDATARLWVSANQSGTQAVLDSFNVSSITDIGVGATTVTASVAMANANYAVIPGSNNYCPYVQNLLVGSFELRNANNAATAADGLVYAVVHSK